MLVSAQPDVETGEVVIVAVNDTPEPLTLNIGITSATPEGVLKNVGEWSLVVPTDQAIGVCRIEASVFSEGQMLQFQWQDGDGDHVGQNDYLPLRPKQYRLSEPNITFTHVKGSEGAVVDLLSDSLALFVTYDQGGSDVWSDNGFTL